METISTIPHAVSTYYDRMLLERALPLLVHTRFGQVRDIPKNGTNVITFRKYAALAVATTPLTEGTTPSETSMSVTDISATVAQYGAYIKVSDFLLMTTLDPVLMEAAKLLGEQAGLTIDTLTRDVIVAGTNVVRAASRASRDLIASTDKMTVTELKLAIMTLKNANAPKITGFVSADPGYGTTALRPAYIGICHPEVTEEMQGLTGWKDVENYAGKTAVYEGEVGAYKDIRFIETTNAKVFTGAGASSIDVYATLVMGRDAYGVTRISGESLKNIVKPLGSAGSADPLDQRATSGWKATFVAKILQQAFIVRIETAI